MGIFLLETGLTNPAGVSISYPFEVNGVDSIGEFCERLSKHGILAGNQLFVVNDSHGGKLVQRHRPMGITVRGFMRVTTYDHQVSWAAPVEAGAA